MGEEIHYYLQCHLVNLKINMPNSLRDGWWESFKHGHGGGAVSLRAVLLLPMTFGNLENIFNTIFISNKTEWKRPRRNREWHRFSVWFAVEHERACDQHCPG